MVHLDGDCTLLLESLIFFSMLERSHNEKNTLKHFRGERVGWTGILGLGDDIKNG